MNHVAEALLAALKVLPAAVAALPEIKALVDEVGTLGSSKDQLELQRMLAIVKQENAEGFERLDKKLS